MVVSTASVLSDVIIYCKLFFKLGWFFKLDLQYSVLTKTRRTDVVETGLSITHVVY